MADPQKDKSPDLLRSIGRCVDQLGGQYITGEDVRISVQDVAYIHEETPYVVGLPEGSGDPSPFTALGVFESLGLAVEYQLGKSSLKGLTVAVQGLGNVGYKLCELLVGAGASLIITDIDPVHEAFAVKAFNAVKVSPQRIYSVEADVFSPCALGAILNDKTIPQLKAKVIVGSANNQLAHRYHSEILSKMNILYALDYVVNAGGLINISYEGEAYNPEVVARHVRSIRETLLNVFLKAEELNISASNAADLIAEEKFKFKQ